MNTPVGQKNRPYRARIVMQNGEASSSILAGMPVCLPVNFTNDGFSVVLPSTGGVTKAMPLAVGIAIPADGSAAPGEWFDIVAAGWCSYSRLSRGTRAATTDAWPSFAALALGDVLSVHTGANALAYSTVGAAGTAPVAIACAGLVGATASGGLTAASTTTAASDAYTAFSGATAYTVAIRSWLRLL
jgi:hypothetical protein